MTNKIRIFKDYSINSDELEATVNSFLAGRDIVSVTTSATINTVLMNKEFAQAEKYNYKNILVITVWYRE